MATPRAQIEMVVDGEAESRRKIETVGDALRGLDNQSLSRVGSTVEDFTRRFDGLTGTLGDIAKFATAGLSFAAFGAMINSAADAATNLYNLSKITGITVENLSGLQLAAQQSGTDLEGVADAIKELSVNMAQDADRFAKLGVTAKDPLEAFKQLSDVFAAIDEPQMRAAFGADALGDSWAVAAPLLSEGSAKIDEMVQKGILLSATTSEMAEKADEFKDRLAELGTAVDGVKTGLAKEMLPALTEVASTISFTLQESGKLEAMWVGLGALGAFAFTDHFSSAEVKIKNLREELAEVQTDLELSKNAPYVGFVGRMLFGETTEVLEERVANINRQIETLQRLQNAPAKPAVAPSGPAAQGGSSIAAQIAEFLKLSEAQNKAASEAKSQANAYQSLTQSIQKKIAQSSIELRYGSSLTASQQEQLALTEQLEAAKGKLSPVQQAHVEMLIRELVTNLEVIESNKRAEEGLDSWNKKRTEYAAAAAKTIQDAEAEATRNEELARTFGKTRSEIESLNAARMEGARAQQATSVMTLEDIANHEKLLELTKRNAAALSNIEMLEAGKKAAESLDEFLDPAKAQTFGEALRESLGGAGTALSALTASLDGFGKRQAEIDEQRKNAALALATGQRTEMQNLQDLARLNEMEAKNRMQGYGDMAGAAAGFFGEQSRGYQTLMTVSKVFHAAELAMTMAELVPKGIAAVLNQGSGDPYTAFGRMAAMAAVVAGLGVAIGGVSGGGMSLSASRQKAQGTGTVLGSDAKSDSIARALSQIEQSTQDNLGVSNEMLISLRNIESGIGQFASLLVRTTGVTGDFGSEYNKNVFDAKSIGIGGALGGGVLGAMGGAYVGMGTSQIGMLLGGPVGMALGAALGAVIGKTFIGKALGSVFGGKQTVEDTGFTFDPTNFSSIAAGSLAAMQYADIKKDGGWFRSDKTSTQTAPLGAEGNRQITGVLLSLYDTVYEAGQILGLGADSFNAQLSQFVVDIGKVSLKGKTDDEIQKELSAVFSKVGDSLAAFGVAGLEQFQQVGEGYLETLARVASNYAGLDAIMASIGRTVGAAGIDSLAARERLISLSGGISAMADQAGTFAQEFLTEAERLAPVQKHVVGQLADMGLAWVDTRDEFKNVILGLNLTTEAGAKQYTSLMSLAEAFAEVYPATEDLTKSMQEIADERKSLQDRLDEMTMTREQLLAKERATIHESNLPLWDRIQSLQAEASAAEAATAAAQQVAAGLMSGVDSAFAVLQRAVEREKVALQSQIANHTEAANKIRSVSNSLRSTIDGMRGPGAEVMERTRAQSDLRSFLAIARAGGALPDSEKLQAVLTTLSQDASEQFASFADYQADFYRTRNDMSDLASISDKALTVEERTLDTLEDQLAAYDEMLAKEQEQIDQLKGNGTIGISIRDAVLALHEAIAGAKANPINAAVSSISDAYQSALGRAPDAAGLEYWKGSAAAGNSISDIVNAISNSPEAKIKALYKSTFGRAADAAGLQYWMDRAAAGVSYDTIEQGLKESDEYKKKQKIPGYAAGGDHTGGWRIVGENGPELEATGPARIFNAGQTRDLMARLGSPVDNSAALADEVRQLRTQSDAQQKALDRALLAVAKYSKQTADLLDRWEKIGSPKERLQ
ncbi:DUF4214 domain-containing protein [Massilia timonae]|uniref:DUF4214 domain-containing protein n=1 Tax=Massilia timonae TaxID=47229 RepID=UPI0028D21657|nr:DUF4214 domain-containing protein [Massilia timonae]